MKSLIIAPAVLAALAVGALAHSGASGVVKDRMEQMKAVAASMKAIGGMIKGAAPYDAAVVRTEAGAIASHGGEELTRLFPEGSTMAPSEALPAIWTEWERFSTIADDLSRYAEALAAGAENPRGSAGGLASASDEDLVGMSPDALFMKVAGTCAACHEDFRLKKN